MFKEVFLIVLGLVWISFAVFEDLKKREIANWLNLSLIVFALGFRFFYSLFFGLENGEGFMFLWQGLIGFGAFFLLGNIFYYSKLFAGGDANLMIALGAVLPFSLNIHENLSLGILFLLLFLLWGAIYGIIWSIYLGFKNRKNFKKDFLRRVRKSKKILYVCLLLGIVFLILSFLETSFIFLAIFVFILPYFWFLAKSLDDVSMVKLVKPGKLTVGDWLYKDVRVGKTLIKSNWNGLTEKDIKLLKKQKKLIKVRYGIPYAPVFFLAFLTLAILWLTDLIGLKGFFIF
jgi:Flp pilus assembly protein protease CpaA